MKELATKLLAIQKEIQPIEKEATNPFYSSKYFDVNAVIAALRPLLNKHGVVVMQPLTNANGKAAIATYLVDAETGQEKMFEPVPLPDGLDAQKMGAAVTYLRRYSLASVFLLEAVDDDGESLRAKPEPKPTYTKPKAPPKPISNLPLAPFSDEPILTPGTLAAIETAAEAKGISMEAIRERALAKYGVDLDFV